MVVAAFTQSISDYVPYLTTAEYQAAPTALDVSNLIVGGSTLQQAAALAAVIQRASSWVDSFTCGANGTLCASTNTETRQVRLDRQGRFKVRPLYWPILELQSFSVGTDPSELAAVSLSSANTWIEPRRFVVTTGAQWLQGLQFSAPGYPGQEQYAQYTYVNGYPNTLLAGAGSTLASGASTLTLSNTTGVYPGSYLTLWDAENTEQVQILAVPTSTTVTLVSATKNTHNVGCSVSGFPAVIKEAAILATSAFIKQRGDGALVLSNISQPTSAGEANRGEQRDFELAKELLMPFRVVGQ